MFVRRSHFRGLPGESYPCANSVLRWKCRSEVGRHHCWQAQQSAWICAYRQHRGNTSDLHQKYFFYFSTILTFSFQTNACLNFDPRRAAGNQVILFSCGGRADGSGAVTDSQLFPFKSGQTALSLQPKNGNNAICLAPVNGLLDRVACSGASNQVRNVIHLVFLS